MTDTEKLRRIEEQVRWWEGSRAPLATEAISMAMENIRHIVGPQEGSRPPPATRSEAVQRMLNLAEHAIEHKRGGTDALMLIAAIARGQLRLDKA
jgi:hypothetical protein